MKTIIIFVEGPDDGRFVNTVVAPFLAERYSSFLIYEYAQKKDVKVNAYLRSIRQIPHLDYIFLRDMNHAPCVTKRKEIIAGRFSNIEADKIFIVIKEIESWYYAGSSAAFLFDNKIEAAHNADTITKEQFNELIPAAFQNRIDFMAGILKQFDIKKAAEENASFRYFLDKLDLN